MSVLPYPRLYIGSYATDLMKHIKGKGFKIFDTRVDCNEEVSISLLMDMFFEYVEPFYQTGMDVPLVLGDLSVMSKTQPPRLLKFLEEAKVKICLFATYDNVLDTIVSRCPTVLKSKQDLTNVRWRGLSSYDKDDPEQKTPYTELDEMIKERKASKSPMREEEILSRMATICPELYIQKNVFSNTSINYKTIPIIRDVLNKFN